MFVSDSRADLPISHGSISTIKVVCADLHDVQYAHGVLAHVEDGQGSWVPGRALARMVLCDSLGRPLRRVWLRAAGLLAVVIWLIMVSRDNKAMI